MRGNFSWNMCRICLQEAELKENLFSKDLLEKIAQVAQIQIAREEPALPKMICELCKDNLNTAYKFRELCINSNNTLISFLKDKKCEDNKLILSDLIGDKLNTDQDCKKNQHIDDFIDDSFGSPYQEIEFEVLEAAGLEIEEKINVSEATAEEDETKIKTERSKQNSEHPFQPPHEEVDHSHISASTKKTCLVGNEQLDNSLDQQVNNIKKCRNLKRSHKKEKQTNMCEICGNIFQYRHSLKAHVRTHTKEPVYNCEICGKSFSHNSTQLKRHMRTHTGEKPFACEYCNRRFSDQSTWVKHKRIHTGERPYKCEICEKSFAYPGVLIQHRLIHTGEKAFECIPCSKRFYAAYHLKEHLKTIKHQYNLNNVKQ